MKKIAVFIVALGLIGCGGSLTTPSTPANSQGIQSVEQDAQQVLSAIMHFNPTCHPSTDTVRAEIITLFGPNPPVPLSVPQVQEVRAKVCP